MKKQTAVKNEQNEIIEKEKTIRGDRVAMSLLVAYAESLRSGQNEENSTEKSPGNRKVV